MPAKKTTTTSTPDLSVFNVEVSPQLIAQAIYVYQSNSHRGGSKTKTRGELDRSTRKIYKQKGTGNARHGARSAPIFVGGGITFGPTGIKTPLKSLNQKMKLKALAGIMNLYRQEDKLSLLEVGSFKDLSTKKVLKLLPKDISGNNYALVHFNDKSELLRSSKNIPGLTLLSAARLNAYKVAQNKNIILTTTALDFLKSRLSKVQSTKSTKKA